jgi:hypothetical protein
MPTEQPVLSVAVRRALVNPLEAGQLGVLLAAAGVGKTACLTRISLEHLFRDIPVLHVCIDDIPETVKVWYHELIKGIVESEKVADRARLHHHIQPLRFILTYNHQTFSPEKLSQSLQNLKEQANFNPSLVILDGIDFDTTSRSTIEELRQFASDFGVSMWLSAKIHRHIDTVNDKGIPYPCHEMDDLFQSIALLEPSKGAIRMKTLKDGGHYLSGGNETFLNPETYF